MGDMVGLFICMLTLPGLAVYSGIHKEIIWERKISEQKNDGWEQEKAPNLIHASAGQVSHKIRSTYNGKRMCFHYIHKEN